jgi:Family of unknown function (DUF5761)
MYSPYNRSVLSSESVYSQTKFQDLERYNGRVNLVQPPSKELVFQMMEKIETKNKATDYRDALTGTWEHNSIERAFFSAENIQRIQEAIKSNIHRLSNGRYVMPNQNIDHLKIIMRGMYLQYAQHSPDDIPQQIERLNKLVLDYVIPNLYNEAISYEKYIRDQSTLVTPLPLPLQHNRDYKHLEIKPWT